MRKITDEYIREIDEIKNDVELIVNKITDDEIDENLYRMGMISMCIRYESFTSEIFGFLNPEKKIDYNHPWSYTRQVANILGVAIDNEYNSAHECWDFYNTLKHINSTTKIRRGKIMRKHNLHSYEQAFYWIHESLVELLNKFYI